ncbi:MAG: type II toxin-antitoxin system Phd/YefM family antitoxin [Actinobacteria bacterium]|nr:type II toxin-antitoxin system Phd/YefM family antitoxin [Actinomycetota bacterium]
MSAREISASVFKQQCLALLDHVDATKTRIVVTKRGKPVAQLVPLDHAATSTMGSVTLVAEEDEAYFSTGDSWSAESRSG